MDAREFEKLEKRMKKRQSAHDLGKWKFVMVYGWGIWGLVFFVDLIRDLFRHHLSFTKFLIIIPVLLIFSTLFGLFMWACFEGEYEDTKKEYERAKRNFDSNQ